jgi:hypothetical protein
LGWEGAEGGEFVKGCPIDNWIMKIGEGVEKFGLEHSPGSKLKKWVEEAGFINVVERPLPIPTGTWPKDKRMVRVRFLFTSPNRFDLLDPFANIAVFSLQKEIGAFDLISFLDNLEGLTMRIYSHAFSWTAEEVKVLCAQIRNDLKNPRLRMIHKFFVVYAQKPQDAE